MTEPNYQEAISNILRYLIKCQDASNQDMASTSYKEMLQVCKLKNEAELHNLIIELEKKGYIDRSREILGPLRRLRVTLDGRKYLTKLDSIDTRISNKNSIENTQIEPKENNFNNPIEELESSKVIKIIQYLFGVFLTSLGLFGLPSTLRDVPENTILWKKLVFKGLNLLSNSPPNIKIRIILGITGILCVSFLVWYDFYSGEKKFRAFLKKLNFTKKKINIDAHKKGESIFGTRKSSELNELQIRLEELEDAYYSGSAGGEGCLLEIEGLKTKIARIKSKIIETTDNKWPEDGNKKIINTEKL